MTRATQRRGRSSDGFSLIELAVVAALVTGLLVFVANFSIQVTREIAAASQRTRESRTATALLGRVARDLEATALVVKPGAADPLSHPWVFFAEARTPSEGADRLKFDTRSHIPRTSDAHESDLAVVSYFLSPSDQGEGFALYRWTSPHLPERLDRTIPRPDDEGVVRLADGLASFGVRFLDEAGSWTGEWDSSTLERAGQLPVAAEISVALLPTEETETGEPVPYVNRVVLPLAPLDLEALVAAQAGTGDDEEEEEEGADEDGDGEPDALACVTVFQCVQQNPQVFEPLLGANPGLAQVVESIGDQCFSEYAGLLGVPVEGCQ